jgi:hypothetical protein
VTQGFGIVEECDGRAFYPCPEEGLIMIAMIIRDGLEAGRMKSHYVSRNLAAVKASSGQPVARCIFRRLSLPKRQGKNAAGILRMSLDSDCHRGNGLPLDQHLLHFAGLDHPPESHVDEKTLLEHHAPDPGIRLACLRGTFSSSGLQ